VAFLQGSALEPLPFLIYINSLPDVVDDGVLLQYADDTTLICSGRNPVVAANKLNRQLQLIRSRLEDNKMQLNVKSNVTWFSTTRRKSLSHFQILHLTISHYILPINRNISG